jgi:LacI family transcriptional regulator
MEVPLRLVVVAHELTNETRAGLAEGVLSHPARLLADTLVKAMAEALDTHRTPIVSQHVLPLEIYTAENI